MNPRQTYDYPVKMISVIIPTLNEAQSIAACLKRLYDHPQSFEVIGTPVVTSARRYLKCGVIRQQILNTVLVILYYSGISPGALKRFYLENTMR